MPILLRLLLPLFVASLMSGCAGRPAASEIMPSLRIAPQRVHDEPAPLVIVLPGRGDSLERLRAAGVAEAIQRGAPQAEVLLTGATLAYYLDGGLVRRLHEQIVTPELARGRREIWLVGFSMGGLGAMMYERTHPRQVRGLMLIAPYLGDRKLIQEIRDAGGPAQWQAGPEPAALDRDNVSREQWRMVGRWTREPALAARIWLACGVEDSFLPAARMIAPYLPNAQVLETPGAHRMAVWVPMLVTLFERALPAPPATLTSSEM